MKKRIILFAVALLFLAGTAIAAALYFRDSETPKAGANEGQIANGAYYYHVQNSGVYRFTPETRERTRVMPTSWHTIRGEKGWFGETSVFVDDYGLYYVSRAPDGDSLFVRPHGTGQSRALYQLARTPGSGLHRSITIDRLEAGLLTLHISGDSLFLQMDGQSGEILRETRLDQPTTSVFFVGDLVYHAIYIGGHAGYRGLHLDGESILPPGKSYSGTEQFGDYLIVTFFYDGKEEWGNLLLTPDGDLWSIPSGFYLAKIENVLLFQPQGEGLALYTYALQTGKILRVHEGKQIWRAVTDGVHLYTIAHWDMGERTDCWKLLFDDTGVLIGLELLAADV